MLAQPLIELSLHFKTQPCMKSHSEVYNDDCEFYHSSLDQRRPHFQSQSSTFLYLNILYIPKLVPEADKPKFALNLAEYNYHILNIKTKTCPYFELNGKCPLNHYCPYIHEDDRVDELNEYRRKLNRISQKATASPEKANQHMVVLPSGEEAYVNGANIELKEDLEHAFMQFTAASMQTEKKLKSVQDYLCAFVNSNGGTLYLGVKHTGHILGTYCDRTTLDKVRLSIDHAVYFPKSTFRNRG